MLRVKAVAAKPVLVAALSCVLALAAADSANATLAYTPCEQSNMYACASLAVPLDPSGQTPGTLTLAIHRHPAPAGAHTSAVVALAGGPGQAALPFTEESAALLGPILATRDLIVFDQRGTGRSGALSCHAFEAPSLLNSPGAQIAECAQQLGPTRTFYTSADSVADIEAIRVAGGYEKLVLYGTSYGTKVAELYAEQHPSHVEALVLDSVVPPNGPDPLHRASFAAVSRVLAGLCSAHACAHLTRSPLADLTDLLRRIGSRAVRIRVTGNHGARRTVSLKASDIFGILLAGDLSPLLRAELLTADRAASLGDDAPLGRVLLHGEQSEAAEAEPFDLPLYFATICEESPFPWQRTASPSQRLAEARSAVNALPAATTLPFSRATMFDTGPLDPCASWPVPATLTTTPEAPLPNVPTLILSGAEDLRTPTSNAQELAAQIPDAHLLVVPQTGHSVLTGEPGECAREALMAQFEAKPINHCRPVRLPPGLLPPPLPPTRITAVSTIRGYRNRAGRTLHALGLTVIALDRELLLSLAETLSSPGSHGLGAIAVGGLRAGWAGWTNGKLALHRYSYIPGLSSSGTIGPEGLNLRIAGRSALRGTLRSGAGQTLLGQIGHLRVRVSARAIGIPVAASAAAARVARSGLALGAGQTRNPYGLVRRLERILGL
ncbi:MAG: alpha/beta fold hydrolase [Solirubrobacteraceae bacterium]